MSVHEIRLPSPPPDTHPRGSMSRLFNQSACTRNQAEIFSDATISDVESAVRKRVGFHPWTTNIVEPQLSTPDSEVAPSLKSLPPSRDCQISARPILKATYSTESAIRLLDHQERKSHGDQMDSLLENLDAGDRSASTDAYQTMISLIRNYEEAPESEILQAKMTKLQTHIRRDLVVLDDNPESNSNEQRLGLGNLVTSALKVLVTMVWSPVYSPCLTDDFCIWAVDRAISVLKEHSAAKANLLQYIHLIATQNFRSSLFTNNQGSRTIRILEALQDLTEHVSGKAVVAERLLVYEKLMSQAKQVMERKVELWMKNLLTAMGHSFKEVRKNALSAGARACNVFADSSVVAIAARQALAEDTGERSVSASITNKLEKLVAAKDDANQIPQLWTVVLMLCNNGRAKLDTWSQVQFHEWLKLIQRCFNSNDSMLHVQALMAWNRLYFIARPYEASDKVVSMLAKPATKKLDAIGPAQSSKGARQAVVSSYCMLLYYAFRPSLSHAQITRMWNEFVVKIITSSFLSRNSANCDLSCRILAALFHSALPASRIWNERRAQENAYLDPLELPAIDNKWIRSHASSILAVLKLLVTHSSFGPDGAVSEQAYVSQCWRNFVRAVRESSSKEIVPSAEAKMAQQYILDFLASSPFSADLSQDQEPRLTLLAKITVQEFTVPSLLQSLEASSQSRVTPVLQELIRTAADSIERQENLELNQKALQRCLKLLQQNLAQTITTEPSNFEGELQSVCQALKMIPVSEGLSVLEQMQATLLDALRFATSDLNEDEQPSESSAYTMLTSTILYLLTAVNMSDYDRLSELLSTMLSSKVSTAKDKTNALQSSKLWNSGKAHLETSVAAIMPTLLLNTSSPTESAESSSRTRSKSKNTFINRLKQSGVEKRPRHDDSQAAFVSIDSSPPQSIQFESQFLTARQKEVRARQENEPAITFADIRSSPSHISRRPDLAGKKAAVRSPELPDTPPLPRQQNEDESDTPTPTPKARKTLQNTLPPDVPSSPASVVGAHTRGPAAVPITSSPIKENIESEDVVQLSTMEEDEIAETIEQETQVPTPPSLRSKKDSRAMKQGSDYFGKILDDETSARTQSSEREMASTNENYETAPAASSSSPISYSDEDDALAASQLSQNLLQESRSVSVQTEVVDRRTAAQKKRKRPREDAEQRSKKRKLPLEDDQQQTEEITPKDKDDSDPDLSDCIVVDTSTVRPLNWRSTRTSRKSKSKNNSISQSPASSQRSQQSSAGTPASQKSTGSRRRRARGTGRLTRSQASQLEDDTETQILSPKQQENDEVLAENRNATLPSEIAETPQEVIERERVPEHIESPALLPHVNVPSLPAADKALFGRNDTTDTAMEEPTELQPGVTNLQAPKSRAASADQPFDPVQSLQGILDAMEAKGTGKDFDLATIHSLCFKIGLKAQQLATED